MITLLARWLAPIGYCISQRISWISNEVTYWKHVRKFSTFVLSWIKVPFLVCHAYGLPETFWSNLSLPPKMGNFAGETSVQLVFWDIVWASNVVSLSTFFCYIHREKCCVPKLSFILEKRNLKHDHQTLIKAKYCPRVAAASRTPKTPQNPCDLWPMTLKWGCHGTCSCKISLSWVQRFMSYRVQKLFCPISQWWKIRKCGPVTLTFWPMILKINGVRAIAKQWRN